MLEIVIIGAGPYGLSLGAHLRRLGVPYRIFGRPMDSWLAHMPKGMMLKSDGFASNIYDPDGSFTLEKFCAQRGIEYSNMGLPVRLDTFSAYGMAFRERMVPELEDKLVRGLEKSPDGFVLQLEDGEIVKARRVVLAVGITHFEYIPASLADLPPEFLTHSYRHSDLESFKGRNVVVIGGGSSATDFAGLVHEAGAQVQLVARTASLKFHGKPEIGKPRSRWQQIRHPQSGLGPGLRSSFFSNAPAAFHRLPESLRLKIVRSHLGPSGGWFTKDKVIGRIPLLLGYSLERAEVRNGCVHLHVRAADGSMREVETERIVAATGYRVNLERLKFMSGDIRSKIQTVEGTPVLSSAFESSVSGLYFVGLAAANSFGPVMRFAFGAGFAAQRLTVSMAKSLAKGRAFSRASSAVTVENEET
jgi:thioredoxin reductase